MRVGRNAGLGAFGLPLTAARELVNRDRSNADRVSCSHGNSNITLRGVDVDAAAGASNRGVSCTRRGPDRKVEAAAAVPLRAIVTYNPSQ